MSNEMISTETYATGVLAMGGACIAFIVHVVSTLIEASATIGAWQAFITNHDNSLLAAGAAVAAGVVAGISAYKAIEG